MGHTAFRPAKQRRGATCRLVAPQCHRNPAAARSPMAPQCHTTPQSHAATRSHAAPQEPCNREKDPTAPPCQAVLQRRAATYSHITKPYNATVEPYSNRSTPQRHKSHIRARSATRATQPAEAMRPRKAAKRHKCHTQCHAATCKEPCSHIEP